VARKALYAILRDPNGNRYVLYLNFNGDKWNWNYNWLDNDWNDDSLSAVSPETLFISLPFSYQESFYLQGFLTNLPNLYRSNSIFLKVKYIFYHPRTWFPKGCSEKFLKHRICEWLV